MGLANEAKGVVRHIINTTTRQIIKDEATRKVLVERYYARAASKVNSDAPFAARKAEDLLNWRATMSGRFICSREVYRANSFYGIGNSFRNYAGVSDCIKACIEHGVHFGDYVNEQELGGSGLPCLVTFGPARLEHIRAVSDVPVVAVGPYIVYAEDYLDEAEFAVAKNKLGKTLMVFPSHSVDRVKVSYELAELLSEIDRIKTLYRIETVLICLYYRDLLNGAADAYEREGYCVVTAGYREDSLFLERQRSLIKLADFTMSNNVGTHVGYCVCMNKPHYVFDQEKKYSADSSFDSTEYRNAFEESLTLEKTEVAEAFSSFENSLTAQQQKVMSRYWGFENIRSSSEMVTLLNVCEKAWNEKLKDRQRRFEEIAVTEGLLTVVEVNDAGK